MAAVGTEPDSSEFLLENGGIKRSSSIRDTARLGLRTAYNLSSSSLRQRSDLKLVSEIPWESLRLCLANIQVVLLGTKLFLLFPAVPLAVVARLYGFGRSWVFALSMLGLTPLAERLSFLTEQIAHYTGPTVGGLLNATCGNATELIIAILALTQGKTQLVKFSLLGSVLSNLLLVLGTSLFCGGLANLHKQQKFDSRQADVNCLMLFLGLLCHTLPMLLRYVGESYGKLADDTTLELSRASSVVMLVAYAAFLIFQLCTHRQFFEPNQFENNVQHPKSIVRKGLECCLNGKTNTDNEDDGEENEQRTEEELVIGFWSGLVWLVGMTFFIALLSEFLVGTIEDAAASWGLSVSFISIILLPIVGNAAEHAGAVIFAFKNKLDISLGVALGSATQISMFVVPLCVLTAWIIGIDMDLDFDLLQTGSLALSIIATAVALQGGTSHYMKGLVLLLFYVVISTCFFLSETSPKPDAFNLKLHQSTAAILGAS